MDSHWKKTNFWLLSGLAVSSIVIQYPYISQKTKGLGEIYTVPIYYTKDKRTWWKSTIMPAQCHCQIQILYRYLVCVLGCTIKLEDFLSFLDDGIILCDLMQQIHAKAVECKVNTFCTFSKDLKLTVPCCAKLLPKWKRYNAKYYFTFFSLNDLVWLWWKLLPWHYLYLDEVLCLW